MNNDNVIQAGSLKALYLVINSIIGEFETKLKNGDTNFSAEDYYAYYLCNCIASETGAELYKKNSLKMIKKMQELTGENYNLFAEKITEIFSSNIVDFNLHKANKEFDYSKHYKITLSLINPENP